jgi:hypothetical protein
VTRKLTLVEIVLRITSENKAGKQLEEWLYCVQRERFLWPIILLLKHETYGRMRPLINASLANKKQAKKRLIIFSP